MHHLKNSKSGNVTVLTATQQVTGILMNLLSHNSETLRILTKFCNKKPSKYRNLVKICDELVKKRQISQTVGRTQGGQRSDLILARGQPILEKGQKRAKGSNENFGANKYYLGRNFWNLAPKAGANLATLVKLAALFPAALFGGSEIRRKHFRHKSAKTK